MKDRLLSTYYVLGVREENKTRHKPAWLGSVC